MKLNLTIERYSGPNIGFTLGNFLELTTLNISHVIFCKKNIMNINCPLFFKVTLVVFNSLFAFSSIAKKHWNCQLN